MGAPRRAFGWSADATAGGTPFDDLASSIVPDATEMWPVQNATVNDNETQLDRNDEVINKRGRREPQEFRQAQAVNVKGRLYPPILKFLLKAATGAAGTSTGTPPAAVTTKFEPVEYGVLGLPAYHLTVLRDDLYEKVAGCQLNDVTFNFPLDGHATFDANFVGLYKKPGGESTSVPVLSAIDPSWIFLLRDAQMLVDEEETGIPALAGFSVTINNHIEDPEFWPKRNRVVIAGTGGDRDRILWFPQQRVLGADREVTGKINFSDVKTSEELAADLVKARQFVFEVEGESLGTTPAANRMFRATHTRTTSGGQGASQLQKDGRITSEYDLGMWLDPSSGKDASFELVDVA